MIGVFDSGLGGLTILKALIKDLPEYDYVYLGDSARTPYGNKSEDVIFSYAQEAVDFLFAHGCELIIFACNTASAEALKRIQTEYLPLKYPQKRVLGVLVPAAEAVDEYYSKNNKKIKHGKKVGIIATWATVSSGTYEREIKKLDSEIKVFPYAAPLLVPLVEEGWVKKTETKRILKTYLRPLKEKKIQVLILGCTHYPFLEKQIKAIVGKNIKIINTPKAVAERLKVYLNRHPEIKNKLTTNKKRKFYTTDNPGRFKQLGEKFLGEKIDKLERIKL